MEEMNTVVQKASKLIQTEIEKTLFTFPMWMRLKYLCNTVNQMYRKNLSDADVNWDKVNEILTRNVDEYDFNAFKRIETADDLVYVHMMCAQISIIGGIWQEYICKDCGKEFAMTYHEVQFYKDKGLHIPKRCKDCRDKRKANKNKI
jgi:hypothetical protein